MFKISIEKSKNKYLDIVKEITDIMNSEKLKNVDKNGYYIVSCFIRDMNNLLCETTIKEKELLKQKGFSNSLVHNRTVKSVLLNTEISELADAVKKDLGKEAEGFELADIVMRCTNFLCSDETISQYLKLSIEIKKELSEFENKYFAISVNTYSQSENESKFVMIEDMMRVWNEVNTSSKIMMYAYHNSEKNFLKLFVAMWNNIIELVSLCDVYADVFLPENLQYYVETKMEQNFGRPFRYNISGNIDK